MRIATKKHLFKKTINKKAFGCIDFLARLDDCETAIVGCITADYDYISNLDGEQIKKAMEVLFDEK